MCGRATVVNPDGIEEKVYGFSRRFVPTGWGPRYNLNPRETIPVVYFDPVLQQKVLRVMHWNFIPSKLGSRQEVDAFDAQYSCFNARIESVATASTFREAWRSQRCLVVVDGMIEWVGDKGNKTPHLLRRRDSSPFALAGLWSRWQGADGEDEQWSCTVIVCGASKWYSRFHDRMALVTPPRIFDDWLNPARTDGQLQLFREAPYPMSKELDYFPISRLVNNPRYDAPDCLVPAAG